MITCPGDVAAEQRARRGAGRLLLWFALAPVLIGATFVALLLAPGTAAAQEPHAGVPLADSAEATNTAPASADTALNGSVVWAERPTARAVSEATSAQWGMHPPLPGSARLACTILADLSADCEIESESPAERGLGLWALRLAEAYRAKPTLSDGTSAVGATTRIIVNFQLQVPR